MSLEIKILDKDGIKIIGKNIITGSDIGKMLKIIKIYVKSGHCLRYITWNFINVDDLIFSKKDIHNFIYSEKNDKSLLKGIHMVMVTDKPHIYGLLRMFEGYTEDMAYNTQCFKNIDFANKWILEKCQNSHLKSENFHIPTFEKSAFAKN